MGDKHGSESKARIVQKEAASLRPHNYHLRERTGRDTASTRCAKSKRDSQGCSTIYADQISPSPERKRRRRDTPSTVVKERIKRAEEQRLYLLDHKRSLLSNLTRFNQNTHDEDLGQQPVGISTRCVLRASLNLTAPLSFFRNFSVTLGPHSRCTCPDYIVHSSCKHILWVLIRCAGLHADNDLLWQVAFTQSELDELHTKVDLRLSKPSHSQAVPVANEDAQAAFEKLAGICVSKEISRITHARTAWENEICVICMMSMQPMEALNLCWCGSCGRSLHRDCLDQWHKHRRKALQLISCPWCRASWVDGSVESGWLNSSSARQPEAPDSKASLASHTSASSGHMQILPKPSARASLSDPNVKQNEGYWNLAKQQGLPEGRATSHGEKRQYHTC